jgi:hypothetical protein
VHQHRVAEAFGLMDRDIPPGLIREFGPRPSCLERRSVLPGTKRAILFKRMAEGRSKGQGKAAAPQKLEFGLPAFSVPLLPVDLYHARSQLR